MCFFKSSSLATAALSSLKAYSVKSQRSVRKGEREDFVRVESAGGGGVGVTLWMRAGSTLDGVKMDI